jgi:hypothetical protein
MTFEESILWIGELSWIRQQRRLSDYGNALDG